MLKNVHLKNLALIKEADIYYSDGLNIMTGETGSGKSIIIGSINIALGDKANKSMIRKGADYGLVELKFTKCSQEVLRILKDLNIEPEDDGVIISRRITSDSSVAKINGETVTLNTLKSITCLLVDIHGQHDHQSLLNPSNHINIIDEFAGSEVSMIKQYLHEEHENYKNLRKQHEDYNLNEEELEREISLLEHEKNEIDDAVLVLGEDEKLETEFKKLSSAEKVSDHIQRAEYMINDDEGISSQIALLCKEIEGAIQFDESLDAFKDSLMDLESMAKDIGHEISKYAKNNAFNEERYHEVQERLNTINHLKSRYGNTIEEILSYSADVSNKLENYHNYSENKELIEEKMKVSASELNQLSKELSNERMKAAKKLEPMICRHLKDLNFLNADFRINFSKTKKISSNGFDKVEFLISTNPGEDVKPLSKVASGGELSRVMLAIKSSVAQADEISTLIFDEIDTGISGKTAQKVAEKLSLLSANHQIICITHLPQIAAMADSHYRIHKEVTDGTTISGIEKLDEKEIIDEIGKMIGGEKVSSIARVAAQELKESANKYKGKKIK